MTRLLMISICLFLIIAKVPFLQFWGMVGLILICIYQFIVLIFHAMNRALGLSSHDDRSDLSISVPSSTTAIVSEQREEHATMIPTDSRTAFIFPLLPHYRQQLDHYHIQQLENIQHIFLELEAQKIQLNPHIEQKIEQLKAQTIIDIAQVMQHRLNSPDITSNTTHFLLYDAQLQETFSQYSEQLVKQIESIYANDMQLLQDHHIFVTQQLKKIDEFHINKHLHE